MFEDESWLVAWHRRGFSTESARAIRASLLAYKQDLLRGAHSPTPETSSKLNRSRFASRRVRELRRRFLAQWPVRWARELVAPKRLSERVVDGIYPERLRTWKPIFERAAQTQAFDLNNFSFVDDPISTITSLREIAHLECTVTEGRLNFQDPLCLDIGPFLVLQSMYKGMLPIFSGGSISSSTLRVLKMVGLGSALGMHLPSVSNLQSIWPLPFRCRTPQSGNAGRFLRSQTSEVVVTEVVEHLNDWLGQLAGMELTIRGEKLVLSMAGEVINNAERHSDPSAGDGTWSIAGFVALRRDGDSRIYKCHLAFLSTGATIAESMTTAGEATKEKMRAYVDRHRRLFSSRSFTEENLQTVFALQDGVSRVHDALVKGRGGTGLMDIIEFFSALSGTSDPGLRGPKLSIVSGATCILVRAPYMHGARDEQDENPSASNLGDDERSVPPRELWFNDLNSQDEPPSAEHVLGLPYRLAGTLITMAWTIDPEFLQSKPT